MLHIPGLLHVHPGLVPGALCDYLLRDTADLKTENATVYSSPTDVRVNAATRRTGVAWIYEGWIPQLMRTYVNRVNETPGWGVPITGAEAVQLGRYSAGSFFNWHIDRLNGAKNMRLLSVVAILTDPADHVGGRLEFRLKDGTHIAPPLPRGTVVVMSATLDHRVTRMESGNRTSLVAWYHGVDNGGDNAVS